MKRLAVAFFVAVIGLMPKTALGQAAVTIGWDHDGVSTTSYEVWGFEFGGSGQWTLATTVNGSMTRNATVAGLPYDREMLFRVRANGPNGPSAFSEGAVKIAPMWTLFVGLEDTPSNRNYGYFWPMFRDGNRTGRYPQVGWDLYRQNKASTRAITRCNLDNTPDLEVAVLFDGFAQDTTGNMWIWIAKTDAWGRVVSQRWVSHPRFEVSTFDRANAQGYLACGDYDGDGRGELIVSGGRGSMTKYLMVEDLVTLGSDGQPQKTEFQLNITGYSTSVGALIPAMCDFDGNGTTESLLFGLHNYTPDGGWVYVMRWMTGPGWAYQGRVRVGWNDYNTFAGRVQPVCGNFFNDDSADEVAFVLGAVQLPSGKQSGIIELRNGPSYSAVPSQNWERITSAGNSGWLYVRDAVYPSYNAINGELWGAAVNIDNDGHPELVVGRGKAPGLLAGTNMLRFDDWSAPGNGKLLGYFGIGWALYDTETGGAYPAGTK